MKLFLGVGLIFLSASFAKAAQPNQFSSINCQMIQEVHDASAPSVGNDTPYPRIVAPKFEKIGGLVSRPLDLLNFAEFNMKDSSVNFHVVYLQGVMHVTAYDLNGNDEGSWLESFDSSGAQRGNGFAADRGLSCTLK